MKRAKLFCPGADAERSSLIRGIGSRAFVGQRPTHFLDLKKPESIKFVKGAALLSVTYKTGF
jgi:hypothetical protein